MKNTILKSIILFIVFFLLVNGLGYINHYLLGDFLLDNMPEAYNIADTFIYLPILLIIILFIKKRVGFNSILKTKITSLDIVIILVLCLLFRAFEDPVFRFKEIIKIQNIEDYIDASGDYNIIKFNIILLFLNTVILAPIVEEVVFRGLILNSFLNKNKLIGVIISSILFAAIHISFTSFITSFLFGIIVSIVFIKKGLIHTILFHMIYNLIWFVLKLFSQEYFQIQATLNFNVIYWGIILLSLITMFVILKFFIQKKITD